MVEQLEKLKNGREGKCFNPFIFTNDNAESIFDMLDPNMNGYISFNQYEHGLRTMGIMDYDIMPIGIGKDQITKPTFMEEA